MIYWRLLLLVLFVLGTCVLTMPGQITQIEYSLSHNRTRMLEEELLVASKDAVLAAKSGDRHAYVAASENLGWIYFQMSDVGKAESTFLDELTICEAKRKSGYDADYAHSLVNIATFYRERANYDRASLYYNKLREYDLAKLRGPNIHQARDLANLGLLFYLWGETVADAPKRADMFCRAESFCETALSQYKALPDSRRAQGDVINTQALILRDLGMAEKADVAAKESRQILAEAGNKAIEP